MRISDWSSDVCSSDLLVHRAPQRLAVVHGAVPQIDAELQHQKACHKLQREGECAGIEQLMVAKPTVQKEGGEGRNGEIEQHRCNAQHLPGTDRGNPPGPEKLSGECEYRERRSVVEGKGGTVRM